MSEVELLDALGPSSWTVTRCPHGCLHLHVGRSSITLSYDEMVYLRDLLRQVAVEFGPETPAGIAATAH